MKTTTLVPFLCAMMYGCARETVRETPKPAFPDPMGLRRLAQDDFRLRWGGEEGWGYDKEFEEHLRLLIDIDGDGVAEALVTHVDRLHAAGLTEWLLYRFSAGKWARMSGVERGGVSTIDSVFAHPDNFYCIPGIDGRHKLFTVIKQFDKTDRSRGWKLIRRYIWHVAIDKSGGFECIPMPGDMLNGVDEQERKAAAGRPIRLYVEARSLRDGPHIGELPEWHVQP